MFGRSGLCQQTAGIPAALFRLVSVIFRKREAARKGKERKGVFQLLTPRRNLRRKAIYFNNLAGFAFRKEYLSARCR